MLDQLWDRFEFLGGLRKHRVARWAFLAWAIISIYDTGGSQFLPPEWAQARPTVYQILAMTTGWLSWEAWLLVGSALLVIFAVGYAPTKESTRSSSSIYLGNRAKIVGLSMLSAFIIGCFTYYAFWPEKPRIAAPQAVVKSPATQPQGPRSLADFFKSDFPSTIKASTEIIVTESGNENPHIVEQAYYDFESNSSFVGYYIPNLDHTFQIAMVLADSPQETINNLNARVAIKAHDPANIQGTKITDLTFSKVVYIYHEQELDIQQIAALDNRYKSKGLFLQLRGRSYSTTRWLQEIASKSEERKK